MHVLLIEDDRQFVELVERVASSLDLEFTACTGAGEGLQRLFQGGIDLLVVDGLLPDRSGWQVLEEVAAWPGTQPIKVFLSAFFRDLRSFRRLKKLGVAKVLHKPITAHALRAEIAALIPADGSPASDRDTGQDSAAVAFTEELARMREAYAEKLATVSAVEYAGLLERAASGDPAVIVPLESFLHRLSGTAGSYGQMEISELAGRLEDLVADQPLSELEDELLELLAMLRDSQRDDGARREVEDPATGLGVALVVTGRGAFGDEITDHLAPLAITTREVSSLAEATGGLLRWWPGFVVVDAQALAGDDAAVSGAPGGPAAITLAELARYLPVIVVGEPPGVLPEGVMRARPPADPGATVRPAHEGSEGVEVVEVGEVGEDGEDGKAGEAGDGDDQPGELVDLIGRREVQPFAGQSLLLCDDDEAMADRVRGLFAPLGVTVYHASDIASYKELLVEKQPSVILMDIVLPMVSGFDLCRMTRADPVMRDIPILFVSARTRQADRRTAYRVGADGYMTKPIVPEELIGAVTSALQRQRFAGLALRIAGAGV